MGAVLLGVVESRALLQVCSSSGQLSAIEQGESERVVSLEEERWVLEALGESEELLSQLPRRVELRPRAIKPPEPSQRGEELRRLPHMPTQLQGPGVCPLHLRGCSAFGSEQGQAEGGLQDRLVLGALGGVRQ